MRNVLFALLLAACAHQPEYRGNITVVSNALIPVDPDVRVVADADKPLFFAAGSYWLFHDASWYRGNHVKGPFVVEKSPPWQIKKIDQPYAFVRYEKSHPRERTATQSETPSKDLRNDKTNRMFTF